MIRRRWVGLGLALTCAGAALWLGDADPDRARAQVLQLSRPDLPRAQVRERMRASWTSVETLVRVEKLRAEMGTDAPAR